MTLEEWVRKGEALLRTGPHANRARADAEFLLRYLLRYERAALLVRWTERLHENEAARYAELVARRQRGEPIQYITGRTEFYGLPFQVTPAVLIPRPETEHLVEKVIALCRGMERPRIVDVGTGSGAIAVALAHQLWQAQVTAMDISADALAVARENAQRNGVAERIRFAKGDLLGPVKGERFEVVASNPPYVSSGDRASMDVEVREFEPETALFAGPDGLAVYRRLIPQAAGVLVPGGHIVLEIGYDQREAIRELLGASGFEDVEFVADLQGIARVAVARRP
jgi:release factor glutamine methyltransferase